MTVCSCGASLTGRQRVRCGRCTMIAHSGSSQCPYCLRWHMTHPGVASEMRWHATKQCINNTRRRT